MVFTLQSGKIYTKSLHPWYVLYHLSAIASKHGSSHIGAQIF